MKAHKRKKHPVCERFVEGTCQKSCDDCWYYHDIKESPKEPQQETLNESGFRFTPPNQFPPEQGEMLMKTLNMVLQRMEKLEERFLQMMQ